MITMEELTSVFRQVFDDDTIVVHPATTANEVEGWDSLSHVNLIVAIETGFGIRFSQKDLLGFRNVGDLFNGINAKLATR